MSVQNKMDRPAERQAEASTEQTKPENLGLRLEDYQSFLQSRTREPLSGDAKDAFGPISMTNDKGEVCAH